MMTFKNAVRIASLLAVVLLAVPAVAGTATYLGTHTASDAQIGDVGAPAFGSMTATYAGATIDLAGGTDGISEALFPDGAGGALSFGTGDFTITMVIESANLPDFNAGPVAWAIYANQGAPNADTANTVDIRDGWGYVANDAGADVIVGSRELYPDLTLTGASPVSFPVTLTIARTGTTLTISADDGAVVDLNTGTVEAADIMYPRLFFFDPTGVGISGEMSVSLIEISGANIPDVNLPPPPMGPTATITRDGAVDSAFTDTTGSWTVGFSEDVINVTDDDFSLSTLGDAVIGSGPTVTGGPASYTVSIASVTGSAGTISLNFDVGDVVASADGTTAALPASSGTQWFSNVVPAPAAMGWVLVFLGIVLALAAAVMLRRKALKH